MLMTPKRLNYTIIKDGRTVLIDTDDPKDECCTCCSFVFLDKTNTTCVVGDSLPAEFQGYNLYSTLEDAITNEDQAMIFIRKPITKSSSVDFQNKTFTIMDDQNQVTLSGGCVNSRNVIFDGITFTNTFPSGSDWDLDRGGKFRNCDLSAITDGSGFFYMCGCNIHDINQSGDLRFRNVYNSTLTNIHTTGYITYGDSDYNSYRGIFKNNIVTNVTSDWYVSFGFIYSSTFKDCNTSTPYLWRGYVSDSTFQNITFSEAGAGFRLAGGSYPSCYPARCTFKNISFANGANGANDDDNGGNTGGLYANSFTDCIFDTISFGNGGNGKPDQGKGGSAIAFGAYSSSGLDIVSAYYNCTFNAITFGTSGMSYQNGDYVGRPFSVKYARCSAIDENNTYTEAGGDVRATSYLEPGEGNPPGQWIQI